jgi:hypothetical protein
MWRVWPRRSMVHSGREAAEAGKPWNLHIARGAALTE